MPNRVIKDSIKRSPQIDSLTWFEEVVFYRLILTADDYGCIDGRPILLRNELFPIRDNVTKKAVTNAISKLVSVGLLCEYTVNGMPYLFFPTWEKHQRIRNKHRKYPEPPDGHLTASCGQMTASCQPESESELESESESESEQEQRACACAESGVAASTLVVMVLPLSDGSGFSVTEEQYRELTELYPAVDVMQQLRNMKGWLIAHKAKGKAVKDVLPFIHRWLSKHQDEGSKNGSKPRFDDPDYYTRGLVKGVDYL